MESEVGSRDSPKAGEQTRHLYPQHPLLTAFSPTAESLGKSLLDLRSALCILSSLTSFDICLKPSSFLVNLPLFSY